MTPRERFVATMTFGRPDRVPLEPGWPRESTLKAWRGQGLPDGADWRRHLLDILGLPEQAIQAPWDLPVDCRMIPQFPEKVLEHRDGHYVVQDWSGNIVEISDQYDPSYLRQAKDFVTRRWIAGPVRTAEDWEQMKDRYRPEDPGRFPADFADRCPQAAAGGAVRRVYVRGPFWQMREWCGLEALCLMMIEQPRRVEEMAEFWTDFLAGLLERMYRDVAPDDLMVTEDMAYKGRSLISPAMTRRFCLPAWKRWAAIARRGGTPVLELYSDGYVGELIPLWIEAGFNASLPMEVAAGCDVNGFRRRFGRSMAFHGGLDKRCIATGGPAIRQELARVEPALRDGGYIPCCDHGVPADVSWPTFVDYTGLLARMTGWL